MGGRERRFFYLRRTLLQLLPCVSVLEVEEVDVEFCEILHIGVRRMGRSSSISMTLDLAYMFSTEIINFSSNGQGIPMTMAAFALRVSSCVYFVV